MYGGLVETYTKWIMGHWRGAPLAGTFPKRSRDRGLSARGDYDCAGGQEMKDH